MDSLLHSPKIWPSQASSPASASSAATQSVGSSTGFGPQLNVEQRNAMLHAQWEQKPFAWYDPSADKFTRDLDDHSMNRGAVLWRLYRDAGAKP